jgi:hypothetical protein
MPEAMKIDAGDVEGTLRLYWRKDGMGRTLIPRVRVSSSAALSSWSRLLQTGP